jgi:hypothetical protein
MEHRTLTHAARGLAVLLLTAAGATAQQKMPPGLVRMERCPNEGLQPQVTVDEKGVVHLVYLEGDVQAGDLAYVRSEDEGETWSEPLRVNSTPGSVDGSLRVRGARLSLARNGILHVAWIGTRGSAPDVKTVSRPLHYTRLAKNGKAFEAQRNLAVEHPGLDAAPVIFSGRKKVFVFWHARGPVTAPTPPRDDDPGRRIYVRISRDDGETFEAERMADSGTYGVSAGCSMGGGYERDGTLYVIYRIRNNRERDIRLLVSENQGETFRSTICDNWKVVKNPRTMATAVPSPWRLLVAWEALGDVWWAGIDHRLNRVLVPQQPRDLEVWRGHPAIAGNERGAVVMAWLEGKEEKEPTRLAWQGFSVTDRRNIGQGRLDELIEDSSPAVFVRSDNGFTILY